MITMVKLFNVMMNITTAGRLRHFIFLMTGLFITQLALSQQLRYKIMQGGDQIGSMTADKTISGNKTNLSMVSEVKKKMILTLEVYEKHTAEFINNILTNATVVRKVNGKVKLDKQIACNTGKCSVTSEGETNTTEQKPVQASVLNIYFTEPVQLTEIYSDNFEKMVPLKSLGNHGYQLDLPDGDSVEYYYANGVCSKVKVNKKLYNLEFILEH